MTRVSSNAGKHPYLRPDFVPPVEINYEKTGIKFDPNIIPKFHIEIDSEYKDKKGKKLYFKDIVTFEKEQYTVGYDGQVFCWIISTVKNPKKTLKLKDYHKSVILFEKYNKKP